MKKYENASSFTVNEIAHELNISRANAYKLSKSAGFPRICIGKRIIIPKEAFFKWMNENTKFSN